MRDRLTPIVLAIIAALVIGLGFVVGAQPQPIPPATQSCATLSDGTCPSEPAPS